MTRARTRGHVVDRPRVPVSTLTPLPLGKPLHRLTPPWLCRLMRVCTPAEQVALEEYRATLGRGLNNLRRGRTTYVQLTRYWRRALGQLENASAGSPAFDIYVSQQADRFRAWSRQTKELSDQ